MPKRAFLLSVLLTASLCAGSATAAEIRVDERYQGRLRSIERFAGEVVVGEAPALKTVRVVVQQWSIGGGLELEELPLEAHGLLVAQLRGGELTTLIGGERVERREGEFWTVPPGAKMGLATEDDTAVLRLAVIVMP